MVHGSHLERCIARDAGVAGRHRRLQDELVRAGRRAVGEIAFRQRKGLVAVAAGGHQNSAA